MTTEDTEKTNEVPVPVIRDEMGRFPAGVSGNPAGRLKGSKNKITLARLALEEELREDLSKKGRKILHKAMRMALNGDDKVMRVLLDKMLATPRGDDSEGTGDRDIKIVLQNFTNPRQAQTIEGEVVEVTIPNQQRDKTNNG